MTDKKKLSGEERRELLLKWLQNEKKPLTGSELAEKARVSRQVIVGDMTLLKARGIPVMATSQGYVYLPKHDREGFERVVACIHPPEMAEKELLLLVDLGILVKDVKIEHSVYGDLTASIMVSNRKEVHRFLDRIQETNAAYLSELTGGVHLHTISAKDESALDEAEQALQDAGFLLE
ncbi:transcription repressor NadR [Domibacillus epiphyticus]|uniref:Transcription repressor NadR n=1 Tax=Domibacillus epiphyticus TaxID=1714355 RepID=A0A1V2A979_9BACI|nr:transcription repressor NadR [Domibacillus epiphyticus]OMP67559.1 transcription repressor NadR [Domibacillus epiphyticus]